MNMTNTEMIKKIEDLNKLEELIEEAKAEAETIKDDLKAVMLANDTEEMDVDGKYIIRWTSVTSNKFDSATFKKTLPDVYKAFLKQSMSRRFSISA